MSRSWRNALLWLALVAALLGSLLLLSGVLLPFLVGMAAAYVLDPVADRLQRLGLSRTAATLALTVLFFATVVPLLLVLVPVLANQVAELSEQLPAISRRCAAG